MRSLTPDFSILRSLTPDLSTLDEFFVFPGPFIPPAAPSWVLVISPAPWPSPAASPIGKWAFILGTWHNLDWNSTHLTTGPVLVGHSVILWVSGIVSSFLCCSCPVSKPSPRLLLSVVISLGSSSLPAACISSLMPAG